MYRSNVLIVLICLLVSMTLGAQPVPCSDPPTMTSVCADACIICDIDGFNGRHESAIVGEAPPGFAGECTFVAHNMQWIAFIAGSVDLEVSLAVSNCDKNNGLEFGLYSGNSCTNFKRISNCFGGVAGIIGPGQSGTINNIEPLVIGQYYYIVMDGGLGDNCDWTFTVISGSTSVTSLTPTSPIIGNTFTCPNLIQNYSTTPISGATIYEWTINNIAVGNNTDPFLDHTFSSDGSYTLCVTAKNVCDEGMPACQTIQVESIPTLILNESYCAGDFYEVAGQQISSPGFYPFSFPNAAGCDSTIELTLTELINPITDINIELCEGDTLFVGGAPYFATGIGQEILQTSNMCDSTVNLDLVVIICNIESTTSTGAVSCKGLSNGQINFSVTNGTAPFNYQWEQLASSNTGTGAIISVNQNINIPNLSAGKYVITIEDNFNNRDIIIATVTEPDPLTLDFVISDDFDGYGVQCFGDFGNLTAAVTGGDGQYFYGWDTGPFLRTKTNIGAGVYSITVTDGNNCEIQGAYNFTEPDQIIADISFVDPGCDGAFTGMIQINNSSGGAGQHTYSLINGAFTDTQLFTQLQPMFYSVWINDAIGCRISFPGILSERDIPDIQVEDDKTVVLGCTTEISTTINNTDLAETVWTTSETLSCDDCLEPEVTPLNSTSYTLVVTSVDGCTDEETIFITVDKERKFYAPTGFSPNGDGINDIFAINGGKGVISYNLYILNRWGNPIYSEEDLDPSNPNQGWDGRFKGSFLNPGVYAWQAEIEFFDGEILSPSGSITLMK